MFAPSRISTVAPGEPVPMMVGVLSVVSPVTGTSMDNRPKTQFTVEAGVFSIQLKQVMILVLAVE